MTLHSLSGAWPISKPVQRLAGIRRLERNARRWRLRISRWIYEVTGPRHALRCFETRVETRSPPDFFATGELSHRCGLLWRAFAGFHHHQLVFTDTVPAPKRRGLLVFGRVEALDALFERRKLDHDEAVEFLGTFENPVAPAAREYFGAVLREDRRHAVGVLPVLDRIVDLGAGYPVGGHVVSPDSIKSSWSAILAINGIRN